MGLFSWFRRNRDEARAHASDSPGFFWQRHPSIYEHIKAHIQPGHTGLTAGGEDLPDEERFAGKSELRWAPGALDGVMSHHGGAGEDTQRAEALAATLKRYSREPTPSNKQAVYEHALGGSVLGLIDPLLEDTRGSPDLSADRVYDLAHALAVSSPDREPVKLGVALLGVITGPDNRDVLLTLGRHDEFTLFCVVALANSSESAEADLWQLAQNVNGWGRVHTVERLAGITGDPRIKNWLLREGFKNSIMNEYLAHTCATRGELRASLSRDRVDDGLLDSAGELLSALISGGPAQGINDYDDGAAAIERYLELVTSRSSTLKQLITVIVIRNWLGLDEVDWKAREGDGWTSERRNRLRAVCESIIARPHWRDAVLSGLGSDDDQAFHDADRAAPALGIDPWEAHWARLQKAPTDQSRWFGAMRGCNADRIGQVVALAERSLPLAEIASGPSRAMGLGKGYQFHGGLDAILQDLGQFPGQGAALVLAGLRSPVIRNRNMALRTLSQWGKACWPEGVDRALQRAIDEEPDDEVKVRMQRVLAGASWDDATRAER